MCRQLQLIDSLHDLLKRHSDRTQALQSKLAEDVDQFQEVFEPMPVRGKRDLKNFSLILGNCS